MPVPKRILAESDGDRWLAVVPLRAASQKCPVEAFDREHPGAVKLDRTQRARLAALDLGTFHLVRVLDHLSETAQKLQMPSLPG